MDWDEKLPGFFEADLVVHCGDSMVGSPLHTLVLVDITTGWTECVALLRRSEADVIGALPAGFYCWIHKQIPSDPLRRARNRPKSVTQRPPHRHTAQRLRPAGRTASSRRASRGIEMDTQLKVRFFLRQNSNTG